MRIVVFGAGSLGTALGGILAKKNPVTLVGRRKNMSAIRSKGLRLIGDVDLHVEVEARETLIGAPQPDLVIISTKAYDTQSAINSCRGWAARDTMVLTVQNGLGNLELLRNWKGKRAFGGTTTMGANLIEPGIVRISGLGKTLIGSDLDPVGARAISKAFESSGLPAVIRKDIQPEIWAKAIVSASINPLTAILRIPNGGLLENRSISRMMSELCEECELVAEAAGIGLPYLSMVNRARDVAKSTAKNHSSMLQDIERGSRTEVGQINGAFVRHGTSKMVHTPLNLTMLAMVESLERRATSSRKLIS